MIDKPCGPTSHDAVDVVRRAYRTRRVGHAGTLDPFAGGLLVVLMGRATRLTPYLQGLSKRYEGTMRLGTRTDTDDATGTPLGQSGNWEQVTDDHLLAAVRNLTGPGLQVPPAYSAKKVGGERAYRRARRGHPPVLTAQPVTVHRFEVTGRRDEAVEFVAEVAGGTYIRALARDVGEHLGCGAHLSALRRVAVGSWSVADAIPLADLSARVPELHPPRDAVGHLPHRTLDPQEYEHVRHGRPLARAEAVGPTSLLYGGRLVAVAEPAAEYLRPRVVLGGV